MRAQYWAPWRAPGCAARCAPSGSCVSGRATAQGAAGVGAASGLFPTLLALVLAEAGWVVALTTFNVTVQMSTPRWVAGRALAVDRDVRHLMRQLMFRPARGGVRDCAAAAGRCPVRLCPAAVKGGDLDLAAARGLARSQHRNPGEGRSGPIVVTIALCIHSVDVAEFLEAMNERRRIRRRDRARNWALMRDLSKPER